MKAWVSLVLFASLFISSSIPGFGQRSVRNSEVLPAATTVFERVSVATDGDGALIRWEMNVETANAGFFVHRLTGKGFELVDEAMTVGSAARNRSESLYSTSYEIFDPQGGINTQYRVEAVTLSNQRILSEIVSPTYADARSSIAPDGRSIDEHRQAERFRPRELVSNRLSLPEDLATVVEQNVLEPDPETHKMVVGMPGAKIGIKREGLVRVMRAQLPAAIFDGTNSENWRLFTDGIEQPIIIGPGDSYIEFYGKGIDRVESDTRMYYLTNGPGLGKRMHTKVLRPLGGNIPVIGYRQLLEKKERNSYVNSIINGEPENYWGRVITNTPSTITFNVSSVDLEQRKVPLFLYMQGYSNTPHLVSVSVNGRALGTVSGNGVAPFFGQLNVNASNLVIGSNTLVLTSTTSSDFSLFDRVTLNYGRLYAADQGRTDFYTPGYRSVDVKNFASSSVRLFDTTYDGNVQQIVGLQIVPDGSTFTVKIPSHRASVYHAIEDSAILTPASVTVNNPSDLRNPINSANMVIISHSQADFMSAAQTWANYRSSAAGGGFSVQVIDVADIFDEFNYGVSSANSLNAFLRHAHQNWQTAPQYVLLIGDGSYDPRNYEGFGAWNTVPTKIVNLIYAESASDEALADFDGDGLAEMAIGRIPARTQNHINIMFNKMTAFETPAMQDLNRGSLFAYDLPLGFDFGAMSQMLRNELPATMPNVYVDRAQPNSQSALISAINDGRYVVNYSGHGSAGVWATTSFFANSTVSQLTNANSQSIFTTLTCLNGYFIRPDADSLAEVLIKAPNGGAAISWASTEKTTPDIQLMMGVRFFNQIKLGNIKRIGDLVRDSKTVIPGGSDVRLSWALFGDPATKVRQ